MLRRKARPKRNKSKSLLDCKGVGDLYRIYHDIVYSRFGRAVKTSIPVLSIFAFLGIITYAIAIISFGDTFSPTEEAYAAVNPLSSLIIDNGEFTDNTTTDGSIFYSSHVVQVKASDIDGYSLTITGPTNIVNGNTTIGSAGNNVTGSNIPNNKWGYAWGDQTTTNSNMLYKGFTGNAQTLDDNTTTSISKNAVDFTKKLVFAVKFADNADTGHYKANVMLNLTLTPKQLATITLADIIYLQDMTPDICANTPDTPIASTYAPEYTLKDARDGNFYKVAKLPDGNCWMTQNLKLDLSTISLTTSDSDISTKYDAGTAAKVDNSWLSTGTIAQFATENIGGSGYDTAYGYYYSRCAATAGTCSSATSAGQDAPSSICPKGWHLPKGGTSVATTPNRNVADITTMTSNDFAYLRNLETGLTGTSSSSWTGKIFAGPPAYITLGGANWYRAGSASSGTAGYNVGYWSRTTYSATSAYHLYLSYGNLSPDYNSGWSSGFPIRCIAYAGERNTFDNITTMQEMTPSVCSKAKIGDTATLLDARDHKTYTIQKLSDGNCWMTSNMTIDLSTTDLTTSDSDVSATFDAKTEYKADNTWTDSNTLVQFTTNGKSSGSYSPAYGYYYSWCAATAGTCSSATTDHDEALSSICPKGWKLPKGDAEIAKNDFAKLMNLEGANLANPITNDVYASWSSKVLAGPLAAFNLGGAGWISAGYAYSGELQVPGSQAYYWSRTTSSNNNAYFLMFVNSSARLYPAYNFPRRYGCSVRCVAYSS